MRQGCAGLGAVKKVAQNAETLNLPAANSRAPSGFRLRAALVLRGSRLFGQRLLTNDVEQLDFEDER